MVLNTDEIIRCMDEKFGFNYLPTRDKSETDRVAKRRKERLIKGQKFPEEDLVTALKLIAASTMANSSMFKNWAIQTSARMPKIDKNFENVKGANGNELAACFLIRL